MKPLLSVIIPFYGCADKALLHRCICSIREQDLHSPYEVLQVDDDGKGLGGARNKGVALAQGEYVLFVDADDYLFPHTLSFCLDLLQRYHPDVLSFEMSQVKGVQDAPRGCSNTAYQCYSSGAEYLLNHNFMGTAWRHLFNREWLLKHQLKFAEGVYHEDEAFVAKAYALAQVTLICQRVVYAYSWAPQSILNASGELKRQKRMADFESMLNDLQQFITQTPLTPLQRSGLQRRLHFLTIDCFVQLLRNHASRQTISSCFSRFTQQGLLPLPPLNYSAKYRLARIVLNSFSTIV